MRAPIIVVALLTVAALQAASAPRQQSTAIRFTSDYHLFLLGHAIGRERVTLEDDGTGRHFTFSFSYLDRGTPVDLTAALDVTPGGDARHFATKGKTYRYFNADSEVSVGDGRAHVRDGANERDVVLPSGPFFPVDNVAPIGVHEQLIRYWLQHRRPVTITAPPAGLVRIRSRADALPGSGTVARVERLSIDGAVWGTETAWWAHGADGGDPTQGHLIALVSWVGGLSFEAVADGAEGLRDTYAAAAVRDRLEDLRALTVTMRPARSGSYAVVGATVIDGTARAPIPNATLVVRDGRIDRVGASDAVRVPSGMPVVNARGLFIMPGLWDMHAHVGQIDWFPAYLASGVTTIRDMGGEFEFLKPAKDALAAGALGPRLLNAGLIDGPGPRAFGSTSVSTPDEARAAVRKYHDAGFEQIKVYIEVPPALVPVITAEAHRLGMTVTGHVPTGMTQQSVIESGFDSIAHMALRGAPGSPEAAGSVAFFKDHHTVIDPTLSWNEFLGRPGAVPLSAFHPDIARLPVTLARLLAGITTSTQAPSVVQARQLESWRLLPAAVAAGVPVVAGTDKGIPGFSLARELEIYVHGGLTPLQAIQAASIMPARVMGLDTITGTIEAGKWADFVVLTGNPLDRVGAIRDTRMVATEGRLFQTAPLWGLAGFSPK